MAIQLYDYQIDAVNKLKNGNILVGGVGSGKSMTAIAYYVKENGGDWGQNGRSQKMKNPVDLYIITTARKRDEHEWSKDMAPFLLEPGDNSSIYNHLIVTVDSWNNIQKYRDVVNSFFIFDEQRVIGYGKWSRTFINISKFNKWILLTATPGDSWIDYMPIFIANGFYKNKKAFIDQHCIYSRFSKFPKIDRYINVGKLIKEREKIVVEMSFERPTISNHIDVPCKYNTNKYKTAFVHRMDPYTGKPILNVPSMCYILRRICNSDHSRIEEILKIIEEHKKVIIFYNYDYELEILKNMCKDYNIPFSEWNGHNHQHILTDENCWVYLVQYAAGSEAWNCIETDTMIFYSQNYSYRTMVQASGRIDRLNTPFKNLFYYHLKSKAPIDIAIGLAVKRKKKFNEKKFIGDIF